MMQSNFNPQIYSQYLSPFGKNVLSMLIKQRTSETGHRNKNELTRPVRAPPQKPDHKVLTFLDSSIPLKNIPQPPTVDFNENLTNNDILSVKSFNLEVANVPKAIELVKIMDKDVVEVINRDSDEELTCNNAAISHLNNINWSDMIDNEILEDIQILRDDDWKSTDLPVQTSIVSKINVSENDIDDVIEKGNDKKGNNKKRKCKQKADTESKKVKKLDDNDNEKPKNPLRKQKFYKTVKNWLEKVSPNNPIDKEDNEYQSDVLEEANKMGHIEILKSVTTKVGNKKVIQAQLANKDGIMKYGKPKPTTEKKIEVYNESLVAKQIFKKEKKVKSKFVAPIKSQIPVKELIYKIDIIENFNLDKIAKNLKIEINDEVIVCLLYSNGFCQLNSHHTDDSCIVEGIMFLINDYFYYIKFVAPHRFKSFLNNIFSHGKIICYGGKHIVQFLKSYLKFSINECVDIKFYDTLIGGSLLDADSPPENFSDLQKILSFSPQFTIATDCNLQKCAWYMTLLKECATNLEMLLIQNCLWTVFINIEMPLLPIIADMELKGVAVDLQKLKTMEEILQSNLKAVEQDCYKAAGKIFQINSTVQVRTILYDELKLDDKNNVKIRETVTKGAKSTSEPMLRSLMSVHSLPKLILEYRHLHKAHATFISGIAQHVKDGVVKPTWSQMAAATGRIASNNPNLQAIPKANFQMKMFPNECEEDIQQVNFRSVYVAREGNVLLAADFKHIECRVFAYVAADTGLLDALKSPDIFRVLAAKWLNKLESDVSNEDRERTKRIVYANLYGAGTRKLMDILDVSYDQTLSIVASFNRTFPSLKSFGRRVVSLCEQNGGRLSTLSGRVRHFKNINSNDFALKSHAERQAINFIVQGTSADLCKMAMVLTERSIRETTPPIDGQLVLQIHDELVWEVNQSDICSAAEIIKQVMESCGKECGMNINLPVSMSRGSNWGEMEQI